MNQSGSMKQPRSFYMIFFLELWERFGYYGLQAILAVYFVKQLNISDADSFTIFGAFSAMVYGLVAIGGWLGDKVLGTKRTLFMGAITLSIGYLMMGFSNGNVTLVYLALGTIIVGNGLFKANPASLVSKLYKQDDPRLDGAYTLYYMSVNIGSFLSMLLVPILVDHFGWGAGFYASAFGMLIAVATYWFLRHWVASHGSEPDMHPVALKLRLAVIAGIILSSCLCAWMLQQLMLAQILLATVSSIVILVFFKQMFSCHGVERTKMAAAFILILQAILFFVLYMQVPTSVNFYSLNNVYPEILGIPINPVAFQSFNPFWIVILSPMLAYTYNRLGSQGKDLPMPVKFSLGMGLCAISFLVLWLSGNFADQKGMITFEWIAMFHFFLSFGELLISGLGLSMVAKLVPQRMVGFLMGAWFLANAAASMIGGFVATFASTPDTVNATALDMLPVYTELFRDIGLFTLLVTVAMFLTAPLLTRMINGKTSNTAETATA